MGLRFNPLTQNLDIVEPDTGISNVVEDTSPQLGGDLDLNGFNLDFPTTPNISDVLDEDNMASDSATSLATQQSIKAYVDSSTPTTLTVDTKENILALTPSSPQTALATDTGEFFVYDADNTQWYITVLPLEADNGKPDIGAVQNNNKAGYKPYMIQSKALVDVTLFNTILKGGDKEIDGAIRLDWSQDPPVVQVYYNNQWNGLTVFSISEGSKLDYFDGNMTLNTYANNSNKIGANGISLTQQGQTCFGAVPAPLVIKGA